MNHGLETFLHAARQAREDDIAASGERDFAAAFERACELEPERFDTDAKAAVGRIEAREPATVAGELDPAFASIVEQARGHVVAEFLRRRDPAPVTAKASRPQRLLWIAPVLVAVAAAALLFVYVGGTGWLRVQSEGRAFEQAEHTAETGGHEGQLVRPSSRPRAQPRRRDGATESVAPKAIVPEASASEADAGEPEALEPTRTEAAGAKPRRHKAAPAGDLSAQAEAAWRRGEFDEAQRLYRTVVRRSGKGRAADLAYGDLMTLARQRGQTKALGKLRREYLDRFPRGRFAEEAKAGLCRSASAGTVARCWRAYLDRWPKGAYRRQAQRAVDGAVD